MTFIKITNKRGYEGYIQTDFIQTIDILESECCIRMNNDPDTITLTLEEWQRIQPLLMPAAAEPVESTSDAYARGFDDGITYADSMEDGPRFSDALVSAYREFQRMLSLTGISQHRIDMQRAILIDLLGANMPLKETDHD